MTKNTFALKPGLLVSITTHEKGGTSMENLDQDSRQEGDGTVTEKKTRRTIFDAEEYKQATATLGKAAGMIRSLCPRTVGWLICPAEREQELYDAIDSANKLTYEFNSKSKYSRVRISCVHGRMAGSDEQATREIAIDVREMLEAMERGIRLADPEMIREAAARATTYGQMLDDVTSRKLGEAIKEARSAATLLKKVGGSAESAANVIKLIKTEALEQARFAFLDLDEGEHVTVEAAPAPDLDMPSEQDAIAAPVAQAPAVEVEV